MKRFMLVLTALLALLLAACGSDAAPDEPFVWQWERTTDNPSPFYGETLTIATTHLSFPGNYRWFAMQYMQRNPGVTIEIIDMGDDLERAREQMGVRLMAGDAPMMICGRLSDAFLPMSQTMFIDWNILLDAHPEFDENDWFMNVFRANEINGQLFSFPLSYAYAYVVANTTVPGLIDAVYGRESIHIGDIIDLYAQYLSITDSERPLYIGNFRNILTTNLWALLMLDTNFFDFEAGEVNFNDPLFADTIARINGFVNPRGYGALLGNWGDRTHEAAMAQSAFFRVITTDHYEYFSIFENGTLFANPMRLTNSEGELIVQSFHSFMLSAGATPAEQALALDFVMFLGGHGSANIESNQHRIFAGEQSTHRELMRVESSQQLPNTIASFYSSWNRALDFSGIIIKTIDRAEALVDVPMTTHRFAPRHIETMVTNEVYEQFHDGLITAEAAANYLQNRITLMLMEMGVMNR